MTPLTPPCPIPINEIGFDFDGVIADTAEAFIRLACSEYGYCGFSRDQIMSRLHGVDADLYTRSVDLLVSRLRRKLEPLDCIKTLRNAGYAFAGARL